MITTLPYDSPLHRARDPENWFWYSPLFEVMAGIHDAVHIGAATGAKRPNIKRREVPKPLVRPWDKTTEEKKLGGKPIPLDDMKAALGW